jgi:amidase
MTNQDIAWLGIEPLAQLIRVRKLSATEVAQAMLRRIEQIDPGLRAYARTTPELALAQAADADARLARGESTGPLHGVPIAVKDLCWTAGIPTAAGTMIHRGFVPTVDSPRASRASASAACASASSNMACVTSVAESARARISRASASMPSQATSWSVMVRALLSKLG